jgi:chromosome partitioning protein
MLNAQPLEGPAPRRKPTAAHPTPPRVVALCGQKGGAGKSTIAVCLAAEALARGRRVLLVDADPQGTARMWGDAALGAGKPAPTVVAMGATMVNPGQLDALVEQFDVVLIDCPGRHDATQRAALMLCDLALLPCGPSSVDAWALASSLELVTAARERRPDLRAAIAITKKRPRTVLGRSARDDLAASGLPVLRSELGDRLAFQECVGFGLGVTTYAPKDPAAGEVRALYDEIFGKRKEASRGD